MKKCMHCGKELPEAASWCPFCENSLKKTTEIQLPPRRRRWMIAGLILAAAVLTVSYAVFAGHRPKVYEGFGEVEYELDGQNIRVFSSFSDHDLSMMNTVDCYSTKIMEGDTAAIPALLFAVSEKDSVPVDSFPDQVEQIQLTADPDEGSQPMDIYGPFTGEETGFPSLWEADVVFDTTMAANTICWELKMKNGDTLRISQRVECLPLPMVAYSYVDTPMETTEQVRDLIEKTIKEETPETILRLQLAPVTYEGELILDRHSAFLEGTEKDGRRTTFTDTIRVSTRQPDLTTIANISFEGNGDKTALTATEGVYVNGCSFSGWDIGADAQNGSWISLTNCIFEDNRIGFRFNSSLASFSNPYYEGLAFRNNGIGIQLLMVPGNKTMTLTGCVFEGNDTDIEDPEGRITQS